MMMMMMMMMMMIIIIIIIIISSSSSSIIFPSKKEHNVTRMKLQEIHTTVSLAQCANYVEFILGKQLTL